MSKAAHRLYQFYQATKEKLSVRLANWGDLRQDSWVKGSIEPLG